MKLTGELKDKVEAVETMEEKKDLIEEAGMELTDEELNTVAGGGFGSLLAINNVNNELAYAKTLETGRCKLCNEYVGKDDATVKLHFKNKHSIQIW